MKKALFGNVGLRKLWCNELNRHIFELKVCSKLKIFDWDIGWRNRGFMGDKKFWKFSFFNTNATFFRITAYHDSDARINTIDFSIGCCSTDWLPTATWKKEMNFLFLEECELKFWWKSILLSLFGISSMWKRRTIFSVSKICELYLYNLTLDKRKLQPKS